MYFSKPDILIVEDEEFNREIMALRLQAGNYNIRFAVDGQQALDMVAEKAPDLILLDIMLPEIMGLQVLHTLRQQYSMADLPIIMVTAIDEDQRIVRALELGANDYVSKPINFSILMARLQTQLSLKQLSALNSEFMATASHDLRKPIAMIQEIAATSRLKLASGETLSSAEALESFSIIDKSANFMRSITECILDTHAGSFSQIRLTKIPLKLSTLITEAIEQHSPYASEKKILLINELDKDIPTVEVDRSRIAQVLDNLINNAIQFCSENDTITISTKHTDDDISLIVSDTGSGLSDIDLQQLFIEDEKQDSNSTKGLGLFVCKQLIDLHNGEIGAMKNSQKGTSFWFKLPVFKLKPV